MARQIAEEIPTENRSNFGRGPPMTNPICERIIIGLAAFSYGFTLAVLWSYLT